MRKSFVALALLVGAAAFLANMAFAQFIPDNPDLGMKLKNARENQERLTRASRLGTFTGSGSETTYVGHTTTTPSSGAPWYIGRGLYNPGVANDDGIWTWDKFNPGDRKSVV